MSTSHNLRLWCYSTTNSSRPNAHSAGNAHSSRWWTNCSCFTHSLTNCTDIQFWNYHSAKFRVSCVMSVVTSLQRSCLHLPNLSIASCRKSRWQPTIRSTSGLKTWRCTELQRVLSENGLYLSSNHFNDGKWMNITTNMTVNMTVTRGLGWFFWVQKVFLGSRLHALRLQLAPFRILHLAPDQEVGRALRPARATCDRNPMTAVLHYLPLPVYHCLSMSLSIRYIHLSIYLSIHVSIQPSIHLSI